MQNQIDIRSSAMLPDIDKVTWDNYYSDHRPVFADVDITGESSPLRIMSWNIQSGPNCYGKINEFIGEKINYFIVYLKDERQGETKSDELQGEDLEIYRKIASYIQGMEKDSNQYNNAVSNAVHDFYYTKRMNKQALLIPKDDLDVIFLQEASQETVDIYQKELGDGWQAVSKDLENGIYPTVTFIRRERLSLASQDNPATYETDQDNRHIKSCQTIDVNISGKQRLELVNYWGQAAFDEENIRREDRLSALEQRLIKPLNGCSMRILGGDTNLHLQGTGDEMTCIGSQKPTQHDVILSSTGNGVIKNETWLKSSYCRNKCEQHIIDLKIKLKETEDNSEIKNLETKIDMLQSISAQISRIQKTQTWFWRWFYKDGSQKIAILNELSSCIYMTDNGILETEIQKFLSKKNQVNKTNESILKESRSFNLFKNPESYNAVEEIKNKPNAGK